MQEALKLILHVQEVDIQMIRLMRLKRDRQKELANLAAINRDMQRKILLKENEIIEIRKTVRMDEGEIRELVEKSKKLEAHQGSIRKAEEFSALSHEMSAVEREKAAKEQRLSDLLDRQGTEEDLLKGLKANAEQALASSRELESEINESVRQINEEGQQLKTQREHLVKGVDAELLSVYERLLRNKKSRVVVPIENRACSGCHILLTAQDENLVRKGERLIFCEHCSRVLYWPESEAAEGHVGGARTRRRRAAKAAS